MVCSKCGQHGHNKKTCTGEKATPNRRRNFSSVISEDERDEPPIIEDEHPVAATATKKKKVELRQTTLFSPSRQKEQLGRELKVNQPLGFEQESIALFSPVELEDAKGPKQYRLCLNYFVAKLFTENRSLLFVCNFNKLYFHVFW